MPVTVHPLLPQRHRLLGIAEAQALEEVRVHGQAPEMVSRGPGGGGPGLGLVGGLGGGIDGHGSATWRGRWRGQRGEVEVGGVEEEEVVEVREAEGGVRVGPPVVGPSMRGLRHLVQFQHAWRGLSRELRVHLSNPGAAAGAAGGG